MLINVNVLFTFFLQNYIKKYIKLYKNYIIYREEVVNL